MSGGCFPALKRQQAHSRSASERDLETLLNSQPERRRDQQVPELPVISACHPCPQCPHCHLSAPACPLTLYHRTRVQHTPCDHSDRSSSDHQVGSNIDRIAEWMPRTSVAAAAPSSLPFGPFLQACSRDTVEFQPFFPFIMKSAEEGTVSVCDMCVCEMCV